MDASIPNEAQQAFKAQVRNAKRRGIPFMFSLSEWWAWWSVDNRWAGRGTTWDALCMARIGDVGPYAPHNVYCTTKRQNHLDVGTERWAKAGRASAATRARLGAVLRPQLGKFGADHPMSRAVVTPLGKFDSAALAAKAHQLTPQAISARVRRGSPGWEYDEPD